MKSIPKLFILFLCVLFIFACQKKEETSRSAFAPAPASAPSSSSSLKIDQTNKQTTDKPQKDIKIDISKRKIIKEGELSFETRDFNKTKVFINKSVSEVQGYIAEENQDKYDDRIVSTVIIRVPAEKFDRLIETLSSSAEFLDKKYIKVLDVTEEYFDVEARLKTRKDLENRYRQLLSQAKKVEDVLNIEKQLGEVREQIESAEGKLKYLNDRIVFSTLTVTYCERIGSPMGFTSKFIQGLSSGWKNFALFVVFLANILPFIVLAIIAIIIFRKYKNRLRIKKDK
jgi:hypothetical protein